MPDPVESVYKGIDADDIVLVLGGVDTGKTYLIKKLWAEIGGQVVDADIGQSDIGPPGVVSRGDFEKGAESGYFVGDVTPRGNLLPVLTGVSNMVHDSHLPCMIDTDGYIKDGAGLVYKSEMVNLVQPTKLILLQKSDELEYFNVFQGKGIEVLNLPANDCVKKSRMERAEARKRGFSNYFKSAKIRKFPLSDLRFERLALGGGRVLDREAISDITRCEVIGAWKVGDEATMIVDGFATSLGEAKRALNVSYIKLVNLSDLIDLLVGCLDGEGNLQLGIIKDIDSDYMRIFTSAREIAVVQMGYLRIDEEGNQLDRVRF